MKNKNLRKFEREAIIHLLQDKDRNISQIARRYKVSRLAVYRILWKIEGKQKKGLMKFFHNLLKRKK
jgi:ActR/RegA family two-component response regulator